MADVLVWTIYVVASVIVVLYGLAACFVAFLRYCLIRPHPSNSLLRTVKPPAAGCWSAHHLQPSACLLSGTLIACSGGACRHRRVGPDTPEFFLTARNSVGTFRIAWSFYAAAMGSWTLFSPASYAWTAGQAQSLKISGMGPKMWRIGKRRTLPCCLHG